MLAALTGALAGALHVVVGPDHLAAIAPLALVDRRRATRVGASWGLGHGLGVALLGLLGMAIRPFVALERLSAWSELAVGFLLVAIGLWALRRAARLVIHAHPHDHAGPTDHSHLHVHGPDEARDHAAPAAHRAHTHAAVAVGMLHGAAGSGHLLGVLPSLALPPAEAAAYLVCYLLAAVGAMAGFGLLLGRVAAVAGPRVLRGLMATSGGLAVVVGLAWIVVA